MAQSTVTGLDVGTDRVRVVVMTREGNTPHVVGVGEAPAGGMRRGLVVDIDDAARGIVHALEMAERSSGVRIDQAFVGVGGDHVLCRPNTGVVAVSRANGEVSDDDVMRVVDSAAAVSLESNREIVHVVPREFRVDGQGGIQDPRGMFGARLETDAVLVEAGTPFVRNLAKVLDRAEVSAHEFVAPALAASEAVLTKRQKELGVAVVNIGGGTSSVAVYEEGNLLHMAVLPVGAATITNDIAIVLRTAIDVADRIKLEYGSALPTEVNRREAVQLAAFDEHEEGEVLRHQVAEIIEARVLEMFDMVNKELRAAERDELLPAGVVLVGGGAKISGMIDVAKEELKLPAQIGFPTIGMEGMVDQVDDPAYATAVGLALWGMRSDDDRGEGALFGGSSPLRSTVSSMRRWFEGFLP